MSISLRAPSNRVCSGATSSSVVERADALVLHERQLSGFYVATDLFCCDVLLSLLEIYLLVWANRGRQRRRHSLFYCYLEQVFVRKIFTLPFRISRQTEDTLNNSNNNRLTPTESTQSLIWKQFISKDGQVMATSDSVLRWKTSFQWEVFVGTWMRE